MHLADIDQHWAAIEKGLLCVQKKTDADWQPEYYRTACREKRAFLFMAKEGFVILSPIATSKGVVLSIEIAYGLGMGLIDRYSPHIEQFARDIGATRIQFNSPRRGFERLPGWTVSTVTYQRSING